MGRRGDGADGHSWAGGLGVLLDVAGNDTYVGGELGAGLRLLVRHGPAVGRRRRRHLRRQRLGAGLGRALLHRARSSTRTATTRTCVKQGWGPRSATTSPSGCWWTSARRRHATRPADSGIGWSINRSVALFLDAGGNDRYALEKADLLPGTAVFDARLLDRAGPSRYWTESVSVGLFLDAGGKDAYPHGLRRRGPAHRRRRERQRRRRATAASRWDGDAARSTSSGRSRVEPPRPAPSLRTEVRMRVELEEAAAFAAHGGQRHRRERLALRLA